MIVIVENRWPTMLPLRIRSRPALGDQLIVQWRSITF